MSLLQNSNAISSGGYSLESSLRFRSSASAYLSRTPSGTGTSRKTMALSWWFKKSSVNTSDKAIFSVGSNQFVVKFNSGGGADKLQVYDYTGSFQLNLQTNQVFRDPSAWYHIVIQLDSTQATASNRAKLYINGEQVTSFASATYPSQNYDYQLNYNIQHNIGNESGSSNYFDGYMTEVNFVDGQVLTPSDFGETDTTTGVWKPKEYTGTYGTNGFYLPMKETQQATGFNTVLYTGTGSAQSIKNVGFSPDLVWIKSRSDAFYHGIFDTVRGAGQKSLVSNTTDAEGVDTNGVLGSFDSDGFGFSSGAIGVNASAKTYVAWCWDAGSSTVSNTDGSITSSVRANPATGFSIVTYTGNATNGATVGHGLGTAPSMIILKDRTTGGASYPWFVYHSSLGNTQEVRLNSTNASTTNTIWNNTSPTSSVFTLGAPSGGSNATGDNYVAYCFSEVSGFSKFGSYTGNGSTSGPTVTTGFRPAFVMIKSTTTAGSNWWLADNTRDVANPNNALLFPNLSNAEYTTAGVEIDFNDTGFQLKTSSPDGNKSGDTFIYMAFADTRDAQFNFDASGNKNNWTANNINSNASSETTYDIMNDVATLTDEDTANFATLNPLDNRSGNMTLSNGNLNVTSGASSGGAIYSTIPTPSGVGKWYCEVTVVAGSDATMIGVSPVGTTTAGSPGYYVGSIGYYGNSGEKFINGSVSSYGATYTTNDVIGVALDMTANTVTFYKNNVSQGVISGSMVSGVDYIIGAGDASSGTGINLAFNFGQRPFKYTPPTGYKKLNTYNLPDSTIVDGSQYFDATTYTGTGEVQSITDLQFRPSFIWQKDRTSLRNHILTDILTTYLPKTSRAASGGSLETVYNLTISADTQNYSVYKQALIAGYDGEGLCTINLTVNSGVVVGSISTHLPALDFRGFPTGCSLNLTVSSTAYIVGAGGTGGIGQSWGTPGVAGSDGGDAIWASSAVTITNNGTIAGGGGGGGAGGGSAPTGAYGTPGGNGGGGAGNVVGIGAGPSTATVGYTSAKAADGTLTTGGTGTTSPAQTGGLGGNGGDLGMSGTAGQNGQPAWNGNTAAVGGAGGAAGLYADGNTYITWVSTGTRLGNVNSTASKYASLYLSSNTTSAALGLPNGLGYSNDNGFSFGSSPNINALANSYVAWNWRASDSSPVSNTDGTITSTVSANTDSGFSIVTYTGNGTSGATVGHGLSVAPSMLIVKPRTSTGGTNNWIVWHTSLPNTTYILTLNETAAQQQPSFGRFGTINSTTFSLVSGTAITNVNANTIGYVAYCFADVEGFSKFGSYTGNGSTDGAFIYTGFRPVFVLIKNTSSASDWNIWDIERPDGYKLEPNTSDAEALYDFGDFLSNGFKIRQSGYPNNSGNTFIYMAFAENPFKQSLAR